MKKIFFVWFFFFSPIAFAGDCNPNAVIYRSSSGFGISLGGGKSSFSGGDKKSINLPVKTSNGWGCYKKHSAFNVEVEKDKNGLVQKFTVSPMEVSFDNVPDARAVQYVHFENNHEFQFKNRFTLSSFICSGEKLLSIENKQFTLLDLMIKDVNPDVSTSSFFATGAAAKNLETSHVSTEHNIFYGLALKHGFVPDNSCRNCETVDMPSVLAASQAKSLADISVTLTDLYTTMPDSLAINPCQKNFEEALAPYRIENFEHNDSLKPLKVKKKTFSKKLVFTPAPMK